MLEGLPSPYRKALIVLVQLVLVIASFLGSFALQANLEIDQIPDDLVLKTLPFLAVVRIGSLALFRLFRGLWRYVGIPDLLQIIKATTASSTVFVVLVVVFFGDQGFPRSVFFLDWAGNIFLLSGVRLFVRLVRERFRLVADANGTFKRLLIVGAGNAGAALCAQAQSGRIFRSKPVVFVDDDRSKVGTTILGVPVAGLCKDLPRVVREHRVDSAVIAIPSATPSQMRSLVEVCQRANIPFKILPPESDILDGAIRVSRIRDVDPVDLLGRATARLDRGAIQGFIREKRILITGAAGSVGSELARQIAVFQPGLLLLIDRAENPLFFLESELRRVFADVPLVAQVGDVTDWEEMRRLMAERRPQVVFHAAAYKHVPLMELTPAQAVKNNIGGTYVIAKSAQNADAETFVLVSTDKAVKPTSVMGATKRVAELVIQEMNQQGPMRLMSVRFGNVIGSNASVVPIFKQQIADGGPITVTHPDAQRYFMSISEAAGLILQAGSIGKGTETFVLDMGEPVRIVALAETLISLTGLKPYGDIDIVFTGPRPGEKLSEELHLDEEDLQPTGYEKLLVLNSNRLPTKVVAEVEDFLRSLPGLEAEEVKSRLRRLVPEYQPSGPLTGSVEH